MASTGWQRSPVKVLEDLTEASLTTGAHSSVLPARAPALGRPTLRAHFGLIPETVLGLYGTRARKQGELDLLRAFFQQQDGLLMAAAPVKPGSEGTAVSQHEFLFKATSEATAARQQIRDAGGASLQSQPQDELIFLPCQDGPGRLPSTLVRVIVSGLPADFMLPGVIRTLLECAGYTLGGTEGVVIRAEHGGEQKAELAAFAPEVMRLGVLVGIVRPPASDPLLSKLPRTFDDVSGTVTIRVTGGPPAQPNHSPQHQAGAQTPTAPQHPAQHQEAPAFVPAAIPAQTLPPPLRQVLLRPLDAVQDLHGRCQGDRRGLGMPQAAVPPPRPPPYPPGFGPQAMQWVPLQQNMEPSSGHIVPMDWSFSPQLPPPPLPPPPPPPLGLRPGFGRPVSTPLRHREPSFRTGQGAQQPLMVIPRPPSPQGAARLSHGTPMEVQPAPPQLPDVPLVDTSLRWLEDEEDPARDQEARREHLRRCMEMYPSVWQTYSGDSSYPPAAEVRTALRELGGLAADLGSEDRPADIADSPTLQPRRQDRQSRKDSAAQGQDAAQTDGPQLRPRKPKPSAPWHSSDRLRNRVSQPTAAQKKPPAQSRRRAA